MIEFRVLRELFKVKARKKTNEKYVSLPVSGNSIYVFDSRCTVQVDCVVDKPIEGVRKIPGPITKFGAPTQTVELVEVTLEGDGEPIPNTEAVFRRPLVIDTSARMTMEVDGRTLTNVARLFQEAYAGVWIDDWGDRLYLEGENRKKGYRVRAVIPKRKC